MARQRRRSNFGNSPTGVYLLILVALAAASEEEEREFARGMWPRADAGTRAWCQEMARLVRLEEDPERMLRGIEIVLEALMPALEAMRGNVNSV